MICETPNKVYNYTKEIEVYVQPNPRGSYIPTTLDNTLKTTQYLFVLLNTLHNWSLEWISNTTIMCKIRNTMVPSTISKKRWCTQQPDETIVIQQSSIQAKQKILRKSQLALEVRWLSIVYFAFKQNLKLSRRSKLISFELILYNLQYIRSIGRSHFLHAFCKLLYTVK